MSASTVPFLAGENIVRTDEQAAHAENGLIGTRVRPGKLWLTNQRIMFQPARFGNILTYPLRRIIGASRSDAPIYSRGASGPAGRTTTYPASLSLEFDNGGKVTFIPQDIDAWVAAIVEARDAAPDLPYSQVPLVRPAGGTNRGVWVMLGIMGVIVGLFLCTTIWCLALPGIWSLLAGNR